MFQKINKFVNIVGFKIWDYRKKDACMESTTDCADYISDLAVSKDKKILLATW